MFNKKEIKMVMLGNGNVTMGFDRDENFNAHVEILCAKYNTNVVASKSFTPDQYEEKKAKVSKNGIVDFTQMIFS